MRNPWRFACDHKTGTGFGGDVGQNKFEELEVISKGGNYGWHIREAMHPFKDQPSDAKLIDPIVEYCRDKGACITVVYVVRGKKFPALDGIYFYSDLVICRLLGFCYVCGKLLAHEELKMMVT